MMQKLALRTADLKSTKIGHVDRVMHVLKVKTCCFSGVSLIALFFVYREVCLRKLLQLVALNLGNLGIFTASLRALFCVLEN